MWTLCLLDSPHLIMLFTEMANYSSVPLCGGAASWMRGASRLQEIPGRKNSIHQGTLWFQVVPFVGSQSSGLLRGIKIRARLGAERWHSGLLLFGCWPVEQSENQNRSAKVLLEKKEIMGETCCSLHPCGCRVGQKAHPRLISRWRLILGPRINRFRSLSGTKLNYPKWDWACSWEGQEGETRFEAKQNFLVSYTVRSL